MSFIKELRKSSFGRVQREIVMDKHVYTLTILCMPFGYRLFRSVLNTWNDKFEIEQAWNFRYLTDLFATAKQEGFFEEIDPNADDWVGDTEPEPEPEPVLSPEEQERIEHSWEIDHPEEFWAMCKDEEYPDWYAIPKYQHNYSGQVDRRYTK